MTADQKIIYCNGCGCRTEDTNLVFFRTPDHKDLDLIEVDSCPNCIQLEED